MQVLAGRYGPYVTDGKTNASLPKTADPAKLTMEEAVALLKAREGAAPKKRRRAAAAPRSRGGSAQEHGRRARRTSLKPQAARRAKSGLAQRARKSIRVA